MAMIQDDESSTKELPLSQLTTSKRMMNSGMPVRMLREKYHQCGRKSSATVSPSWIRFRGYAMARWYGSRARGARHRSRPAELAQASVGHAEIVADLVQHRRADGAREAVFVPCQRAQGSPEHRDPVRRDARVRQGAARSEGHTFVETEQRAAPPVELRGRGPVLHRHRHVLHLLPEFGRDGVERVGHHGLEALLCHLNGHRASCLLISFPRFRTMPAPA